MASSGMLRRVALVRTDVSEELSASIIRVTRISELGTTLTLSSNRHMLQKILTSQQMPFFIVTAVKTSNFTLTLLLLQYSWHQEMPDTKCALLQCRKLNVALLIRYDGHLQVYT
jgi:hypothetical protein